MAHHLYLPDANIPRHKQLKRLILAIRDMQSTKSAISSASSLKENDPIRAHLISIAVVYYARPFVSTRGFPRISGKWEKFDDSTLDTIHHFVCEWRNAAVAHSEDQLNDVEFMPKGTKVQLRTAEGKEATFTMSSHGELHRGPKFPDKIIAAFVELCTIQERRMKVAASEEKEKLFHEFIKPAKKTG